MMCVKLTLPIPPRLMYELMARRLTSKSRAGTLRKLVAVGTVKLRSMLATIAAPEPRMGSGGVAEVVGVTAGLAAGALSPDATGVLATGAAFCVTPGTAPAWPGT